MGAVLDDGSVLDGEDDVGVADGGEAMRDRDGGSALDERLKRLLDDALAFGVQRRRGLVEDQNRWVLEDHARDGQSLALPTGESVAALAHHRVIAVLQRKDALVDERGFRGGHDLLVGGGGAPVADVLADRAAEEIALLGDHPDGVRDRLSAEVAYVVTVDRHRPVFDVVQARDEVGDRRLARARGADQRGQLPGQDPHRDVTQCLVGCGCSAVLTAAIAKRHMLERDFASDVVRVDAERVIAISDARLEVDQFEDPSEQCERRLDVDRHLQELVDREQQPALQSRECHQCPRREVAVSALKPGHEIDQRRADPEERLRDGEERSADNRLPDLQIGLVGVLGAVASDLVLLASEHLGQQDPGYREGLLSDRAHDRQRGLGLATGGSSSASDAPAEQDEERCRGQRDGGQQRREQQHRHHRGHQRDHVADHRRRGRGDRRLHSADIVGQP